MASAHADVDPPWHFLPETVAFLQELRDNNEREWFEANKARYERLMKAPGAIFAGLLGDALAEMLGEPVTAKVFRVHRDVRFSKDKTPYKPHIHMLFQPSGADNSPKWFFGLEPDRCVVGTGNFGFDKAELVAFRERVAGADGEKLAGLLETLRAQGAYTHDPDLKRMPSGFAADHPQADLLKRKGLSVWFPLMGPEAVMRGDATATVANAMRPLQPVYDWLCRAG